MSADRTRGETLTQVAAAAPRGVSAAAAVAVGGATAPYAFAGPLRYQGRWLAGELSVVQWTHFVPRYDTWLRTWARGWGEQNDVEVNDRPGDLHGASGPAAAARSRRSAVTTSSASCRRPRATKTRSSITARSSARSKARSAPTASSVGRSTYNPRTKKYFGVSDYYVPAPVIWRHDLWNSIGESPATWDHVRAAAPELKALGHPIGIGQSNELDSNIALISLLMCFGSFVQDESNALTIDSKNTVEAVRVHGRPLRRGEESTVFGWKPESNNQFVLGGKGSLIVNAISAIRRAEELAAAASRRSSGCGRCRPAPAGGSRSVSTRASTRSGSSRRTGTRPRSSSQTSASRPTRRRRVTALQLPELPGAVPAQSRSTRPPLRTTHPPRGKYSILATVASKYTRNVGYPGYANAAVQEMLDTLPDPPDVRAGLPGKGERRGLGPLDLQGDEANLGEVARRREDLAPERSRRPDSNRGPLHYE